MAHLVSRADLARIARVKPPNITKAAKRNFPAAVVGDRIDLDHPDVQRYLRNKDGASTRAAEARVAAPPAPTTERPSTPVSAPSEPPPEPAAAPAAPARRAERAPPPKPLEAPKPEDLDVSQFGHWTLNELGARFGTMRSFNDYLAARKAMADTRDKEVRVEERMGRLIPKDFVQKSVISYIGGAHTRLLQDTAPTIARRLHSESRAGRPVEELEALTRELIGAVLGQMKSDLERVLLRPP